MRVKKLEQPEVEGRREKERPWKKARENPPRSNPRPMHMLDIPMDSLPYGGRVGPVFLLLPPSLRRRLSFVLPPAPSELSFQTSRGFPPFARANRKRSVRRHAHVPNSHSLPARERAREAHVSPSPYERDPGHLYKAHARVRSRERSPRALTCAPFCRAFSGPAFQNCPRDGSTDKCSFLFATHAWAISGLAEMRRD